MRRRALLAALPTATLAACSAPGPEDAATDGGTGASDGGSAASDAGSDTGSGAGSDSAAPSGDPAEQAADRLDAHGLAGQLVLVGVTAGDRVSTAAFSEHRAGGLFLLGRWTSADAVRTALTAARDATASTGTGVGPLLAVDQEGGQIRMLRGDAARETPSAADLGRDGAAAVTAAYTSIGEDLSSLGIALDLAPVADVVDPELGDDNEPVGKLDRGFGTDPALVAPCVEAAVTALAASQVAATLKHFPGLGRVSGNTDHTDTGIEDATTDASDPFLDPFRAGIAAGAGAVMVSSAIYPQLEDGTPAMFSSAVVTDLLRGDLGFEGLAITDDVGAAAAVSSVPVGERATRFLAAGGDVVLTADPALAGTLVDAIVAWAQESPEHADRVRESAVRALRLKASAGLLG